MMQPAAHLHVQIADMVDALIDALGPHSVRLSAWLEDADRFEVFDDSDADTRESVAYAFGYLAGIADGVRVSVVDLIEAHRRPL